ncbi:MAG: hypothetical protein IPG01_13130 [Chitinophagaceae bacterium]|nr:hypothetical protein [Chitinophagaceae bacterium]
MTQNKAMSLLTQAFLNDQEKYFGADLKKTLRVLQRCSTKEEETVVLLHQLLIHGKHLGFTIERLKQEYFSVTILNALSVIFRRPEDAELAYLEKLKGNLLARRVRIAELADNLDLTQLATISKGELDDFWIQHQFYMKLVNCKI